MPGEYGPSAEEMGLDQTELNSSVQQPEKFEREKLGKLNLRQYYPVADGLPNARKIHIEGAPNVLDLGVAGEEGGNVIERFRIVNPKYDMAANQTEMPTGNYAGERVTATGMIEGTNVKATVKWDSARMLGAKIVLERE